MVRKSNAELLKKLARPGGLAAQLEELRKDVADITGSELAARTGWQHSKVSKIETAKQPPTEADIAAWVEACSGSSELRDQLVGELRDAQRTVREHEYALRSGQAETQQQVGNAFKSATTIRNFDPFTIPGLLQTMEYARYRMRENAELYRTDPAEVEAGVAARWKRQDILTDASKRFDFIITQSALYPIQCPPRAMRGQLDRLLGLLGSSNIRFGIVPIGDQLLRRTLRNSFLILDDLVLLEMYHDEIEDRTEQALAMYSRIADDLLAESAEGDEAAALILGAKRALPGD